MKNFKVSESDLLEIPFIFRGIKPSEVKSILKDTEYKIEKYGKGEKIFDSESFEHSIAFILDGDANVYRSHSQKRTLLSSLSVGDSFGAAVLFSENEPFPTTIYAMSNCTIMFINQAEMEILITKNSQIAMNYIIFLSKKIRFLNNKLNSFSSKNAEEKTAKFILGNQENGRLVSPLNMKQISSSLGIGRASLYRVLSAFEEKGFILKNGSEITLTDRAGLEKFLGL